jgi:PAS domain S-box-containing protein
MTRKRKPSQKATRSRRQKAAPKGARQHPGQRSDLLKKLRARAEILIQESARQISKLSEADARKLVRELQLHQLELEMQNEELRRTRLELEATRNRYSILYDFAPVGYLTLDAGGIIREANLTAATLLGIDREELKRKKFSQFLAAKDRDFFQHHRQKIGASGVKETCQLSMRRSDGAVLAVELESIATHDENQMRRQLLVVLNDITGRMRLERERSRLAAIVESSRDAIIGRNLEDTITDWNAGAEKLLGYTAGEIIGRPFARVVPPEKRSEIDHIEQQILAGEHPEHYETTRLAKDGRKILVSVTSAPIRDAKGGIIGIASIARDIARQKQAEEALRHSERDLADFFKESPLGLLWAGPNGHVLRVNRAQLELLNLTSEEVIGHSVKDFIAEEETAEDLLGHLNKGETLQNYRARLKSSNGTLKHVLVDANGLWEGGKLVHSRWFVRDISRRLELEREILATTDREQRRIGQDLHDDLGQQLAGIEFLTQTLAGQLAKISRPAEVRARDIARMVQHTMTRARELARGLSPIGLESDGLTVSLRELAARTRKLFRVDCRFKCKGTVLIHDHHVGIHLYRIAQEAVSNAVKHGKASRIDIGLTKNAERIVLAVSDNGIGLPIKLRNKKGMGLHVMQYRAGVIDASLIAQRQPDGGTAFVCAVKEPPVKPARKKS